MSSPAMASASTSSAFRLNAAGHLRSIQHRIGRRMSNNHANGHKTHLDHQQESCPSPPSSSGASSSSSSATPKRRRPKERVAIIGSGLAGLCAAHFLSETSELRERFEVHIFERNDRLGLAGHSIKVGEMAIDVPMRSVNAGYYPNLMCLYHRLGIRLKRTNFSFSFSRLNSLGQPFLIYNGQNGLRGMSIPTVSQPKGLSSRASTTHHRVASLIQKAQFFLVLISSYLFLLGYALYHHLCGHLLDPGHPLGHEPLHKWTRRYRSILHPQFVETVLYTLFSAITTSSISAVEQMPASEMLLYVAATFLRDHYAVEGGLDQVEASLLEQISCECVHTGLEIIKLEPKEGERGESVSLLGLKVSSGDRVAHENYQHIIMATPAPHASMLINSHRLASKEREHMISDLRNGHVDTTQLARGLIVKEQRRQSEDARLVTILSKLDSIGYEKSVVINHTDESHLPIDVMLRRDLNLVAATESNVIPQGKRSTQPVMATHIIPLSQNPSSSKQQVLQTTNPLVWPAEHTILSRSIFMRAITPSTKDVHAGLFDWQLHKQTIRDRLTHIHSHNEQESARPHLRGDWLSELVGWATGRRWVMTLGHLQRSQSLQDSNSALIEEGEVPISRPCLWVCGSYAQGIPLLEGCVTSSALVAHEIIARTHRP